MDTLVKETPNLGTKLTSLFMYTITTYSYIESIVADIFINVFTSALNAAADANPLEKISLMIRNLSIIVRSGFAAKYVTNLNDDQIAFLVDKANGDPN